MQEFLGCMSTVTLQYFLMSLLIQHAGVPWLYVYSYIAIFSYGSSNFSMHVWSWLYVHSYIATFTGPRSAVGNVSGYRCVSDCRSRGREFDPGPVTHFRGDWSWNNFYSHSPPFRWFLQEGLLSVSSKSMCTNYWLTACSSLPRKKCG